MLTSFGKFCRKLRIDNGELLKDMANKLGVTSSYLSAVENGKRNVPQSWVKKISSEYSLDLRQIKELKNATEESQFKSKLDLKDLNNNDKNLMTALARKINGMNDDEKVIIKNLLNKKK
ncbi:helix-turn-helix domain-containing protein [Oceanobacillus sojae]|uniref:helix-turn-helix domain-containing protein n=1 Tax=Oceanobacillus sojae TaxID=582851 RepID=UPI0021A45726|nr:helix-turn-helix transcriptional regulator [Oceanobacillus sojae]MCT1904132.1 helix-turn-helix domain-containing protein [Oceanobacillus sojae]